MPSKFTHEPHEARQLAKPEYVRPRSDESMQPIGPGFLILDEVGGVLEAEDVRRYKIHCDTMV